MCQSKQVLENLPSHHGHLDFLSGGNYLLLPYLLSVKCSAAEQEPHYFSGAGAVKGCAPAPMAMAPIIGV
jgi:hypothetical protein